ncbi:MAG: thiamine-phosphate kinase [Bdellovibrionota bacterium]
MSPKASDEPSKTVGEVGEFGLIALVAELGKRPLPHGVVGIGDDCAVVPVSLFGGNGETSVVITTDTMVENRHFQWELINAFDLGWRLLAVNLSDVAAMGGVPRFALVSLQLRSDLPAALVQALYRGIEDLAKLHNVHMIGGNTTQGTECAFTVTVFGVAPGLPLLRNGARPGDDVWVTGTLGSAGAGLTKLLARTPENEIPAELVASFRKPIPRVSFGRSLGERKLATAMIDVSDGLFQDLGHITDSSGVGAEIDLDRAPVSPETLAVLSKMAACTCGDDYELLFTAGASSRGTIQSLAETEQLAVTCIGAITRKPDGGDSILVREGGGSIVTLSRALASAGLEGRPGYRHFSS